MSIKKFRFAIKQRSKEKSLFSISESANGDIQVNYSRPKSKLILGSDVFLVSRRSMTVHLSNLSSPPIRMVTNKLYRDGQQLLKSYSAFKLPIGEHYIWPVSCDLFGTDVPDINQKRNLTEQRVPLAVYDSTREAIFASLLISNPDFQIPAATGLSSYRLQFREFSLTVLYTLGDIRSPRSSFFNFLSTAESQGIGSVPLLGLPKSPAQAFSTENIEPFLLDQFYQLSACAQGMSGPIAMPVRHTRFRRFPAIIPNCMTHDLTYGVNPIIGSKRTAPRTRINPAHQSDLRFSQDDL